MEMKITVMERDTTLNDDAMRGDKNFVPLLVWVRWRDESGE
jgi:hypothetical protein